MELPRNELVVITGLSPVISIEQTTTNRSPRSTVGAVTDIYDLLRLLCARAGAGSVELQGLDWRPSSLTEIR